MFQALKRKWAEARADVLKKEVEDTIARIDSLSEETKFHAMQHLINALEATERDFGSLKDMPNSYKKNIAKILSKLAKKIFNSDMGKSYGIFLCSAHIESLALPGENAHYVQSVTQRIIDTAQELLKREVAENDLDAVAFHLKIMGYDLLPYGVGVAQAELLSGYNAVETASHIAFTTLALDVKKAGDDIIALTAFIPHGNAIMKLLKKYKDDRLMNPTQFDNDSMAVYRIISVDEYQQEWIDKILSDPISGKERLAKSRIDYGFE